MHERTATIPASPQLEQLLDERDTILDTVTDRLADEVAAARAEQPRVDTKAGNLQQLCSGLLLAGLALLSSATMPAPATALGWAAAGLLGAAIVVLSAATRPKLPARGRRDDGFGFVRWARYSDDHALIAAIAGETGPDADHRRLARQVRWLSRSLYTGFARIRAAQALLVTALALAALAAALTATGR